uniref:Uncharacterized protein n=1 Tax=Timema bartmani TaxID=61472 RepID=A0A7R9F0Z1_9NEOP|nr:unnamed protein product [Timema bartmani]
MQLMKTGDHCQKRPPQAAPRLQTLSAELHKGALPRTTESEAREEQLTGAIDYGSRYVLKIDEVTHSKTVFSSLVKHRNIPLASVAVWLKALLSQYTRLGNRATDSLCVRVRQRFLLRSGVHSSYTRSPVYLCQAERARNLSEVTISLHPELPFPQRIRKLTTSKVITSQANQDDDQWYKAKLGRIKRKQEKFQQDDGVPVYLKGGILDKFLYQATMGLSVIGLGLVLHTIYEMAVPKK